MINNIVNVMLVGLTICYPIVVYLGLTHLSTTLLASLLLIFALLRLLMLRSYTNDNALTLVLVLALALFALFTMLREDPNLLRYYPTLCNVTLLLFFAYSLWHPPSMVERFARLSEPQLELYAIEYTRRVTLVWCVFFIVNGTVSVWTAVYASWQLWSLYNGLIAYVMMGALFAIEYMVRLIVRANHQ